MEDVEVHIEGEEENDFKNKGRHTAQWRVYTDLCVCVLAGDMCVCVCVFRTRVESVCVCVCV